MGEQAPVECSPSRLPNTRLHIARLPPACAGPLSGGTRPVLLIEIARQRGEDPGHYLRRAALAAIENPGTVTIPKRQA